MTSKNDPLTIIFEKHLYNSEDKNHEQFCNSVVNDYLNYLRYSGAIIPLKKENLIIEEVKDEVYSTLKKFLGSHPSISSYLNNINKIAELRESSQKKYFDLF